MEFDTDGMHPQSLVGDPNFAPNNFDVPEGDSHWKESAQIKIKENIEVKNLISFYNNVSHISQYCAISEFFSSSKTAQKCQERDFHVGRRTWNFNSNRGKILSSTTK